MDNNELYHYGVLGMRWGVRRSPDQLARARHRKDEIHDDYKKAHSKKSIKAMSNDELRSRNNRLNMEKQYKDLSKKTSIGKKMVKAYVAGAATIAGVVGATATYKKYGNLAFDKIGNWVIKDMKF